VLVHVSLTDLLSLPLDAPTRDPNALPPVAASELVAQLGRQAADLVITKKQWGAFYGTDLDQQLRRQGFRRIVLEGIATNFGVEPTARAAFDQGTYQPFPPVGRVRTTGAVLDALRE
jgi:nicotinamidase-related amidase